MITVIESMILPISVNLAEQSEQWVDYNLVLFLGIDYFIYRPIRMNADMSPVREAALLSTKATKSPFKKFPLRLPKFQQQNKFCSPLKYINTDANPEIGKHLAESAHHLGGHNSRSEFLMPQLIKKVQENTIITTLKTPQSSKPQHTPDPLTTPSNQLTIESAMSTNRTRQLSYNHLTISPYSPKMNYRKSEVRPSTELDTLDVPETRDRKLSYQVSAQTFPTQASFSRKENNQPYGMYVTSEEANRRLSDLGSGMVLGKNLMLQQHQLNGKMKENGHHSHKLIPEESKNFFPTFKNSKFRKNSQNENNLQNNIKAQVPSFLLKKIQKQTEDPKPQQNAQSSKDQKQKQKPLTLSPQSSNKQKKLAIKDFTLLKELGQGKFGKVLLVKQKATGFVCAMKVFKKSQIIADNFIDQFIREMKIQMFLNHPNIVKMYGYFDDLSFIYILLEVATEGTLYKFLQNLHHEERLKRSALSMLSGENKQLQGLTGLTLKETAFIMYQLCTGVNYLHSNNIIHRDLKPQNIVIHQKTIKLCDFGWSVFKGSQMRTTFCGTPLYLCPQLITGQEYDEKVDIWAIGIMLYEFLIGPNPFDIRKESDLENIIYKSVDLNQRDPTLKERLDPTVVDLINGCLNKDPLERYDIKQIVNHQFFKKYSPELIANQNNGGGGGNMPRSSSLSMGEM